MNKYCFQHNDTEVSAETNSPGFLILIFAQNIDCGYTLEPPLHIPILLYKSVMGYILHGHVFLMENVNLQKIKQLDRWMSDHFAVVTLSVQ